MQKYYTISEVAARLHRKRRWLVDWLTKNKTDAAGEPFSYKIGTIRRFSGDDIVRMIDLILTQEEASNPKGDPGVVYFVAVRNLIKIGYSQSLENRLAKIKTDSGGEIKILHLEPGTAKTEKILHRQFAAHRSYGEWFEKHPDIIEYIEQRKSLG